VISKQKKLNTSEQLDTWGEAAFIGAAGKSFFSALHHFKSSRQHKT
jgi:hypothetical protein